MSYLKFSAKIQNTLCYALAALIFQLFAKLKRCTWYSKFASILFMKTTKYNIDAHIQSRGIAKCSFGLYKLQFVQLGSSFENRAQLCATPNLKWMPRTANSVHYNVMHRVCNLHSIVFIIHKKKSQNYMNP